MSAPIIQMAEVVDEFIALIEWDADTSDTTKERVIANLRRFWCHIHSENLAGCQAAAELAYKSTWHVPAVVRGIPVYICADEFTEDQSVGMNWGPEQITAFRRDDATVFELTQEEIDHWSCEAAKSHDPHHDDF